MEKFLGSQSSRKKPIVGAKEGSTWGFTVVESAGGGDGVDLFVHETKILIVYSITAKVILLFTNMLLAISIIKRFL